MEYHVATLEGRRKLLMIGLLERTIKNQTTHQLRPKFDVTYASLEKIWELSSMRLVSMSTKKGQRGARFENTFLFLKTINFTVVNVIRNQLKSLEFSFIYPKDAIEICHYSVFNWAKFQRHINLKRHLKRTNI